MRAEIADLEWPPDLLDDEEQDEPLAGQDHHDTIDSLHYPLRSRLSGPHCFVAAELRVHRNPRNLRDYREPDILVAFGVPDRMRRRYLLWEEGKAPDLVIEVLSPSSEDNGDLGPKRDWYRREGVREYVVLDPSGEFAPQPRMQAWVFGSRSDGSADTHRVAGLGETLWSTVIPFGWRMVEDWVRAVERDTGEVFPPIWELEPRLRNELRLLREAQAQAEEQARQALEREREAIARAEQETALRKVLEEEMARLRRLHG